MITTFAGLRFAVGVACMAFSVSVAVAADAPARKIDGLSAFDLFALAERQQAAGKTASAITIYDGLAHDPSADIRAEARFRKAALLALGKRYKDAAVLLRSILDEQPEATSVRLELARVLALMGDEVAARRALRQAETSGLPADVAATVQQFSRALRSTRRFGGSLELSFAPDSNVNRATDARTLDTVVAPLTLSREARAQSGLGVKTVASAFLRHPLTDSLTLLPRVAMVGSFHRKSDFNDMSGSALLGVEWGTAADRVTSSIGGSVRHYGDRPYARSAIVTVDWLHPIGDRAQLLTDVSASKVVYSANPLQSGALYDLRLTYERALGARRGVSVGMNVTRQLAKDPGYGAVSGGINAFVWQELGGATAFASIETRHFESDARLFLFTDRRREWFIAGKIGATFRQLKVHGFAPVVRLGWERNFSTVGLYDYRRLSGEFGLSRAI